MGETEFPYQDWTFEQLLDHLEDDYSNNRPADWDMVWAALAAQNRDLHARLSAQEQEIARARRVAPILSELVALMQAAQDAPDGPEHEAAVANINAFRETILPRLLGDE